MEVVLDPHAGLVLSGHDAPGRCPQLGSLHRDLLEALLQFDAERDVVDDEAGLCDQVIQ
jgi:hypothetical protein